MIVDPSLTISIDRAALDLDPLVLVASGVGELGITAYREPAMQARLTTTSSQLVHGDVTLGWSWQQALLDFSFTTRVDTETDSRALVAAVRDAISQGLSFAVTVTASDAPAETWSCNPGSLTPDAGRSRVDMKHVRPVWSVSLPCYPIRSVA